MKRNIITLVFITLLLLTGCSKPHTLAQSTKEIINIKLARLTVENNDCIEYDVIRELSKDEQNSLIKNLNEIKFHSHLGPAMGHTSKIIIITYNNGEFEILSDTSISVHSINGGFDRLHLSCNKEAITALIDSFL